MKIQPSYRPATDAAEPRPATGGARTSATATGPGGASTQVALSATSAALQSDTADVNLERVQALREAIREGRLPIDAGRIADGLIESTRELLQGR
ncbi:MAG: flagellar biosynthesis anti-sigma factor FlgM [Pigmentiphaga sp.]